MNLMLLRANLRSSVSLTGFPRALTIRVAESAGVVLCLDRCDLPLPGTVSRANRKRLHDILFVTVVGRVVEPPVRNEGVRVAEVSRRCIGAVLVDRNDGLGRQKC